jgi:hypothetical protein
MIAALYVDVARGPYAAMEGVDCWGIDRDAKTYDGPWPVVAHPPCGPYSRLRAFCTRQDPECALRAVEQVRKWGGILEHPYGSSLWEICGLPVPGGFPLGDGFAVEFHQCRFGNPTAKRSWFYIVGCEPRDLPPLPPWRAPTHIVSGLGLARRAKAGPQLPEVKKADRHLTPPDLARWLVAVANLCRTKENP